jgi:hypothetical protein
MKWYFKDPTASKDDQVPLTPEECEAIYKGSAVMVEIFIIILTTFLLL